MYVECVGVINRPSRWIRTIKLDFSVFACQYFVQFFWPVKLFDNQKKAPMAIVPLELYTLFSIQKYYGVNSRPPSAIVQS